MGDGGELAFKTPNTQTPLSKTDLLWCLCLLQSVIFNNTLISYMFTGLGPEGMDHIIIHQCCALLVSSL